jgi:uncharacterized protein (TIGR03790 family)
MKKLFQEVWIRAWLVCGLAAVLGLATRGNAAVPLLADEFASKAASAASGPPPRQWMSPPRVFGRLTAKDLGVVINTDDPYSVQVGEYYAKARGIAATRVLRVKLPIKSTLTPGEFEVLKKQIDDFFGPKVQALALTWRLPYGVECNSITGALALGYDPKVCSNSCMATKPSTYFASVSTKPYTDHGMRLSMLLAAKDADSAKALIDRGVRSDGTLGLRGAPPVAAHFVTTSDAVRSVRQTLFPPAGRNPAVGLDVYLDQTDALKNATRVVLYETGLTQVDFLDTNEFVPGALGDHLTSFGGILDKPHGQMTVLSWIEAGVTASYGTTSEPCAHPQKFPHPQALIGFYLQGATALEAYWKSVAWPQQGLFVGEPLAAPFAH